MDRRNFLCGAATTGVALCLSWPHATWANAVGWPVGCFNRPWAKWSFDECLKGVKAAGYATFGLLSRTKHDPFIGTDATPDYIDGLKRRIAASGLTANLGSLRLRLAAPLADAIKDVRAQIDNAHTLSLGYVMTFGADNPKDVGPFVKVMADAAAYAQDKGVAVVMKPHGGISGAAAEILKVIKAVDHRNFSIWYDAGNIIHYTGKDPVSELDPIAAHVTGFCAKDCGAVKGDVMTQLGTGKVDFAAVFKRLKSAGFQGPIMLEGSKVGSTAEETTANAKANREFLERALASL
ncbi:MAG TPA: sugar phosphate isomerase/epimerase [Fimbriiglobus sp.]|nr:sugar phosphate isomerase/epimerase [Fimbriiglobus sp.]